MLEGMTIANVLLAVVGLIVFVGGFGILQKGLAAKGRGAVFSGTVQNARHITRKNEKGQLIQNYYQLHLSCHDGQKTYGADLKSPHQYVKGDVLRLTRHNGETVRYTDRGRRWYDGLIMMLCGAGIFALPYTVNRYGDPFVSLLLSGILLLGGLLTLLVFLRHRRREVRVYEGEVTEILLYDVETQRKILKVGSYYPVITYQKDGEPREMLSEAGSSVKSAFTVGKKVKVYEDAATGELFEEKESVILPVVTAVFWVLALMGIFSIMK